MKTPLFIQENHEEISDGYFDGLADDRHEYPDQSNRSAFYRHGWLNGRDDRLGKPRAIAAEIRQELTDLFSEISFSGPKDLTP